MIKIFSKLSILSSLILSILVGFTHMAQAEESDLNQFLWDNRLLLVFTPNIEDPRLGALIKELRQNTCGVQERDMLVFQIVKDLNVLTFNDRILPFDGQKLRETYRVENDTFATILIGKDGAEKLRSSKAISVSNVFDTIDAMPMRQDEMESRINACG
jgi:hypothetical protein